MPQAKPQQVTEEQAPQAKTERAEEQAASLTQETYEEIHAAIQELSRLIGVPFQHAAGYQVPLGYKVYTYPSLTQQVPQPAVAGPNLPISPPWPNSQQVLMASASPMSQPYVLEQLTGVPALTTGYSAWGP